MAAGGLGQVAKQLLLFRGRNVDGRDPARSNNNTARGAPGPAAAAAGGGGGGAGGNGGSSKGQKGDFAQSANASARVMGQMLLGGRKTAAQVRSR